MDPALDPNSLSEEELDSICTSGLCVDSFVGIIDPLRPDVPHSVAVAQAAGVKVNKYTRILLFVCVCVCVCVPFFFKAVCKTCRSEW